MYRLGQSFLFMQGHRNLAFLRNNHYWNRNLCSFTRLDSNLHSFAGCNSSENNLNKSPQKDNSSLSKLHQSRKVSRTQLLKEKAKLGHNIKPEAEYISKDDLVNQGCSENKEKEECHDSEDSSDRFGELAAEADPVFRTQLHRNRSLDEEGEDDFHRPLAPYRYKKVPWWYGKQIEKLGKQGKVREAIAVLEEQMLVKDRVMPTEYCFTALIGCLGRVGYTKKAFSLYNKMKQMGIRPSHATYTALFNACSNSPFQDGLHRATKLLNLMREKGIQPNLINYKAMIKAFGRGGDLLQAFSLMDELCQHHRPDEEVFCFLLMACIADKEAGLKHAIEVWRRQRKSRLPFNTNHYNLLLRAVKECRMGDEQHMQTLIKSVSSQQTETDPEKTKLKIRLPSPQHTKLIELSESNVIADNIFDFEQTSNSDSSKEISRSPSYRDIADESVLNSEDTVSDSDVLAVTSDLTTGESVVPVGTHTVKSEDSMSREQDLSFIRGISLLHADVPNLLNPRGKLRDVIQLNVVNTPAERFLLLGGLPGFLSHMVRDEAKPDIKTFTQCLDLIPGTRQGEKDLMMAARRHNVSLDTAFFNLLIKRRCKRHDMEAAKAVLEELSALHLKPDIMTFGCLALGCLRKCDGLSLLDDMKKAGFTPNMTIYNTLSWRSENDFYYKIEILKSMKANDVGPDRNFLHHMERAVETGRRHVYELEHHKHVPDYVRTKAYLKGFRYFRMYYRQWLKHMTVQEEEHPWTAFRDSKKEVIQTA